MEWGRLHQFNEHHPEFKGFSAFYNSEIYPLLLVDETQRLRELKRLRVTSFFFVIVLVVILSLVAFLYKVPGPVYLIIAVLGLILAFSWPKTPKLHVAFKTKKNIVGGICRFLGWSFETDIASSPHIEIFTSLGLITSQFEREIYEDRIYGEVHGTKFESYEAHLLARQGTTIDKTWETKFRGQFLILGFNRKTLGRTVVFRDKGRFNPKKKGDMKRVSLVDPVFERIFEAYSTDQVEARYLLTPDFMQRLIDLERSVNGQNVRFGFTDGHLLIVIENGNRYEAGSMFESLTETSRTQNILDDIGAIYGVIDGVTKRL